MKHPISFFLLYFLSVSLSFSQNKGKVEIIQDPSVKDLLERHIKYNEAKGTIPGYRIQIYFDSGVNSKGRAYSIKSSFLMKYPDIGAYIDYKAPNYKIRVGNFRTKLDAFHFLQKINDEYSGIYIVKEDIIPEKIYIPEQKKN